MKVRCLFLLVVICDAFADEVGPDDNGWIDPYDMLNYDSTSKRMRTTAESETYSNVPTKRRGFPPNEEWEKEVRTLRDEIDKLQKEKTTVITKQVCLPVFKRYLTKLLKETAKLALPDDPGSFMHYDAEVKLSKQMVEEIKNLLSEGNWTPGATDNALSQILVRFKHHDYEAWKWRFEDTFHVEIDTVLKVSLLVLIVTAIICTELWCLVSWFVQFKRMFAVCFFISLIWNWFHLYMLAFAEHKKNIIQVESFNDKCTGLKQMDWKDGLSEWYRSTFTLRDDPCQKYYEVLVVNPILLVPPTKAITVTVTSFITDPLKNLGQGISEFLKALLKDLPVSLQIPVLVIITLAILVFVYGSAQAAIKQAIPWPHLHQRQDPPPPALGANQRPALRQDEGVRRGGDAPQPLYVHYEDIRNRAVQDFRAGNGHQSNMDFQNRANGMDAGCNFTERVRVVTVRPSSNSDEPDIQRSNGEGLAAGENGEMNPDASVPGEDETQKKPEDAPADGPTPTAQDPNQGSKHKCAGRKRVVQNLTKRQVGETVLDENSDLSFCEPVQETGQ